MPRSVEHIVATHKLATERRKAGKPVWEYTVDISRPWNDDSLSYEEKRDQIVGILKRSRWYRDTDEYSDLHEVVDNLADAPDVDEFDGWWDQLYDLADYDRAWIET